jgi:hypothetical protein
MILILNVLSACLPSSRGNFVCKKECGAVFAENVNFSCPNSYTYAFQLQNNLPELEVTSALIHSITPEGVTLSNQFFNFYQDPLDPNGGTSQTLEVEIFLDSPLEEDLEVCFSVTYFSKEDECCFFEHCIILEAVNPCESVGVVEALETEKAAATRSTSAMTSARIFSPASASNPIPRA